MSIHWEREAKRLLRKKVKKIIRGNNMACCNNCGSQIPDGTNFCPNCGVSFDRFNSGSNGNFNNGAFYSSDVYMQRNISQNNGQAPRKNPFGKFFGILLLILEIVALLSDSNILTLVLSTAVIIGCLFCLGKKYRLRLFTVVALLLAVFGLLLGISEIKSDERHKEADKSYEDYLDQMALLEYQVQMKEEKQETSVSETVKEEAEDKSEPEIKEEPEEKEEATEKEEQVTEETTVSENPEPVKGLDPDFKAYMDSYEAFMDEYVEFMKTYLSDSGNMVTMVTEYAKMMKKYAEFEEKVEKYDTDEMSDEDAKYYFEVMNRVNKKLLEIE